jgi:molecular chaperone DnaK (HSP70)
VSSQQPKYCLGIDLGTTNSVLAYVSLETPDAPVEILPIPQLVAAGTLEARSSLPSFTYLPAATELKGKAFALPWDSQPGYAVGELARRQSADVPTRTVVAAKSWLCHSRVDRHQPILPAGAPEEVDKISPIEASRRYLAHLAAAWNSAMPDSPLAEQQIVLTVPASFDASARELTREAALLAGLPEDTLLLEEPQAAVYAWLADQGERWRRQLKLGDTLLVCDIGGGTSDFTLIGVAEEQGELALRRIAVGNHLLLGGDNMDLALAHHAANLFREKGIELDPWQSVSLWHSCRLAKETLLGENPPETHPISVLGRGSKLIGGTVSVELKRADVAALIANGFFPGCAVTDRPARRAASGFRELGLPFEADAAVTRHLAAFLAAQGDKNAGPARPTHVLFNGGVFRAPQLRERLLAVIGEWFATGGASRPPQGLAGNHDLDLAVARGAAYYGLAKRGRGVRIRGGTARAYYVGIETTGLAIPGAPRPLRGLCVVPMGMEEGTETDVPGSEIGLVVGEPANFRFFSSSTRRDDRPGAVVSQWSDDEIAETDSLEATLPPAGDLDDSYVPVRIHSRITELGVLELWCVSVHGGHRWKLEFSVRDDAEAAS